MTKESAFGAKPEQLQQLLTAIGLEESNTSEQPDRTASSTSSSESLPGQAQTRIGRYKLLRILGEGGMGMVYLAEQQGSIRRRVALKVIKPGMDSRRVIARFEAERQALALLDHPGIAQVHDAGAMENGRPYFVMEYVKGLPITEYCDHRKLSIEDRLDLFQQICHAVHYAHQKGIIHRDIKPSNILVSTDGDRAIPKIIDFGVAKAMSQPLTEHSLFTEDSRLLGTPEYMSPEQMDTASENIDTRSDIYSLGVLLYELLAGVLPFDHEELRKGGIENVRRMIQELDPKTPSTRLTRLGEEAREVAKNRRTEIAELTKCLHRELEWIPLKAMQKDRAERYRSATELADDIENYLKGDPLLAGPPSAGYRLKKFLQRHRALAAGTMAVAATLIVGLIVSTALYFEAKRARAESDAVIDFLQKDLLAATGKIKGRDATVADVLDVASKNLEGQFQDQPIVKARIHKALGEAYDDLSIHKASLRHGLRVYQIYQRQYGETDRSTSHSKNWLANSYRYAGQYDQAERLFNELIEAHSRLNLKRFISLDTVKSNLACVHIEQGRYKEAESFFVSAFETKAQWWRDWVYMHLADVYLHQGRYEEAESQFNTFREVMGPGYLKSSTLPRLGHLYMAQNRDDEAEDLFTQGIEFCTRELPGKDRPTTLAYMNGLAVLRTRQGNLEEAESLFQKVWEARKRKLGDTHPKTLDTINDFGVLRREQKDHDEAESLLHLALDGRQRRLGRDHPACFASKHELAVLYKEQTRYDEAESLLIEAVKGRRLKLRDQHPSTLDSLNHLIDLYKAWGKPEKAKEWQENLSASDKD